MVYSPEQLERMKRNLGITDDDYLKKPDPELYEVNPKNELYIYSNNSLYFASDKIHMTSGVDNLQGLVEKLYFGLVKQNKENKKLINDVVPKLKANPEGRKPLDEDEWSEFLGRLSKHYYNQEDSKEYDLIANTTKHDDEIINTILTFEKRK
jgi:hypothetical protein